METISITINVDRELKDKAQHVFKERGLDISTAVNMFLRKTIDLQESPVKANRSAAFGCLKGRINVPDNFNETLDDFVEYM
ncbi:MAG: type II toxin-antitoxin system RelB/DinJ family antitoxin [Defluviitaleaceae bacterium]|nr:type II toxin-antitoxin system RelB/DinJ family antitoxin [Defluviitaleaceae bacterium]